MNLRWMLHYFAAYVLVSLATINVLAEEIYTYEVDSKEHVYHKVISIKSMKAGYLVTSSNSLRSTNNVFVTNTHFSILEWVSDDPEKGTEFVAKRLGNSISIKGSIQNEAIEKKVIIDSRPWYQEFSWALRYFVSSENSEIEFWGLKEGSLKPYLFRAQKGGLRKIELFGKTTDSTLVTVSLSGWLSLFFSVDYWFRKSDGIMLETESGKMVTRLIE